jgi:hypothetical protein
VLVPALERLSGWRIVATPDAIDDARWLGDDVVVLRIVSDEAFGIGAEGVEVDDPDGIAEDDRGFVGAWLDPLDVQALVAHADWGLPTVAGELAHGKIAGVPVKFLAGDRALLVTQAAYAHDLTERLGWLP